MANIEPQIIVYDSTNVGLAPMLGNTQTFTGVNTFSQNIVGNLTGDVTGNVTGTVTGASSLNVLKAGDTMTGALNLVTLNSVSFDDEPIFFNDDQVFI